MSKFVNYKKRSITLPGKCKDLIDVLQPHGGSKNAQKTPGEVTALGESMPDMRTQTFHGKLSDLEKYVRMVFDSRAPAFMVTVIPPNERFTVRILRMCEDPVTASITFRNATKQTRTVQAFFAQHGLEIPENSGMPPTFLPNLPVDVDYDIAPMVPEPSHLSRLVSELLTAAFELSDDSPLRFHCAEFRDVA